MGRAFADWAQQQLWAGDDNPGLAYLRCGGLTDETIRHFGLGWNPKEVWSDPHRWGLEGGKKIWLPRGVVIPGQVTGDLWYVKVRRFDGYGAPATEEPKYPQIRGSKLALFGADDLCADGRPLLLCEGERDAMLAHQELASLVDVATFGGAGKRSSGRWLVYLLPYQLILAAYDADQAGVMGAKRLAKQSRRVIPVRVPHSDDLTHFHQQGGDLQAWLSHHLGRLGVPSEPQACSQGPGLPLEDPQVDSLDLRSEPAPVASSEHWLSRIQRELPITIDELADLKARHPELETKLTWPKGSSGLVLLIGRK
jgi:hypothetical protein